MNLMLLLSFLVLSFCTQTFAAAVPPNSSSAPVQTEQERQVEVNAIKFQQQKEKAEQIGKLRQQSVETDKIRALERKHVPVGGEAFTHCGDYHGEKGLVTRTAPEEKDKKKVQKTINKKKREKEKASRK